MGEAPADLESTLDRLIARLAKPGAAKEAKALLVDVRRLRTLVGNWRTIQPTDEARKEMGLRVEQLQRSADALLPPEATPPPEVVAPRAAPAPRSPAPSPPPAGPSPLPSPPVAGGSGRPRSGVVLEEIRPGAISEPYARRSISRDRLDAERPAPARPMSDPSPARGPQARPGSDPSPARGPQARPGSDPSPARGPQARFGSDPSPVRAPQPRFGSEPSPARGPQARSVPEPSPGRTSSEPPPRLSGGARGALAPLQPTSENEWDEPPSLIVPARSLVPMLDEPTRAAPIDTLVRAGEERAVARATASSPPRSAAVLDPQRPRTLPDLDISGIAQLLEEGHQQGFDDTLEADRPTVARSTRADFDAIARGRSPSDAPPAQKRPTPTPANGRRRAEAPAALDPGKSGRPSRLLIDPENDPDDPSPRTSLRPSSSAPPAAARSDKTLIAVRPLPAPEVLDKRLVLLTDPFSTRADAYRALRRKLSGPGAPRTIAVTSAQPEEGKTSCAVNLALAFRETSSERVLLLEANLKAPALAKLFGFEPPVCFAKQMAKNRDTTRASWTVVEQFEPLHVLAVDPSSKTSPLLDPVAFANALEQLVEAGYDHIIVDTPPALGGSDVNLIADAVDGIVVVAWIKKSKKSLVKKAIEQLRPATILGVVTLEG